MRAIFGGIEVGHVEDAIDRGAEAGEFREWSGHGVNAE